jgi:DNA-binding response OmpR family regulator
VKILVIDDDEAVRGSLRAILEFDGLVVEAAEDGEKALKIAVEFEPDLIICDVKMPGLSGHDVVRELRRMPQTAATPVMMLTASHDMDIMRKSMDLGADDYLTKPFTRTGLLKAIKTRMNRAMSIGEKAQLKVDEFLSSISATVPHELRTPLASIIGYSEFISNYSETISVEDILDMVKSIHSSGLRLHDTIEKFILFSRLSMLSASPGAAEALRGGRCSSSNALSQVLKRAQWLPDRFEDLVLCDTDIAFPMEEYHLYRAIEELLCNAVKFSEPGTPVTLAFESDGSVSSVRVTNFGRGMTPQQVELISAFKQFDRERFEQQGLGLGLVTLRMLADLYDGDLDIISELGGSTEVTFSVPAAN